MNYFLIAKNSALRYFGVVMRTTQHQIALELDPAKEEKLKAKAAEKGMTPQEFLTACLEAYRKSHPAGKEASK